MLDDPAIVLDPAVVQDPYPFYARLRAEHPVWEIGDSRVFMVSSFALLAEAARRVADFSSELKVMLYRRVDGHLGTIDVQSPATLSIADPPLHTRHKQMVFPRFVSARMQQIEGELTAFARTRIAAARDKGRFDFMEEIGAPVPIRAIVRLIGFRGHDDRMLMQAALDTADIVGGTKSLEDLQAAQMRTMQVASFLAEELEARAGGTSEDLLDAVKASIDSGDLSMLEGLVTMITLFAAGAESTGSLLGNAVRILAERPDMVRRLRADPQLLPLFIEEAGRFESPFRHHLRSVPRDTELGGVKIPAGSTVMLMWGSANRDPAKFDNPDDLTLDRKQQHVTFGRGIHLCVGAALARMEARIVLGDLLAQDRFPELDPSDRPDWQHNLQVRRHRRLPLVWN